VPILLPVAREVVQRCIWDERMAISNEHNKRSSNPLLRKPHHNPMR
jgi:hypothetical protein